jgi:hypothetical protein
MFLPVKGLSAQNTPSYLEALNVCMYVCMYDHQPVCCFVPQSLLLSAKSKVLGLKVHFPRSICHMQGICAKHM